MTEALARDNGYLDECKAMVIAITDQGGIVLDRSVFDPTRGSQPGDSGDGSAPGQAHSPEPKGDGGP